MLSQVSGSTIVAGTLWTGYYIILSTFSFPMKDWSFEVLFKPDYSMILFNHWKQIVLNTSTWALQPVVLLHVGYPPAPPLLSWIKSFSIWTSGSVEGTELGSLGCARVGNATSALLKVAVENGCWDCIPQSPDTALLPLGRRRGRRRWWSCWEQQRREGRRRRICH